MKLRHVVFVLVVLYGLWQGWSHRSVDRPSGQVAVAVPEQTGLDGVAPHFEKNGYDLTALARFDLTARALGVERYRFDREAELSPIDVAFGWGPMSDSAVLSQITIRQSGRFYFWSTPDFPIPRREIETNSANMHLIPARREIEKKLAAIRPGSVVALRGYLVEARARDGWTWRSSLTREDTGNGACELFWIEKAELR